MYDFLVDLFNILSFLFEGYCAQKLFNAFAERRNRTVTQYSAGIFWFVVQTVCYIASPEQTEKTALIKLILYFAVMLLFSVCCCKGTVMQRIFPAVQFLAIRELSVHSVIFIQFISGCILEAISELANNNTIPIENALTAIKICSGISIFAMLGVKVLLIYYVKSKLIGSYRYKQQFNMGTAVYLLPSAVGITVSVLIRLMFVTIENGYTITIYSRYPALYIIVPAISLLLLASVVLTFRLCQDLTGLQIERAEKVILENQIEQLRTSIEETEVIYDNVRSVRHDMKNNMSVLRNMLAKKLPDDEEIHRYFEDMNLSVEQLDSRIHTGNAASDTVIGSKFRYAQSVIPGIKLDADNFLSCGTDGIKAYDLGIILCNGLDNAIEACLRLKENDPAAETFIAIRSYKKKNMYFVEIENSFDGVFIADENGLPVSSKNDAELHGIGVRNIKKCAEKYSGGVDFNINDSSITIIIMLKAD